MKKVKFIFGIHNHQPVGNFDFVFEDAYQQSYLPFLQVLERHPGVRMAIHFTGILLDWLEIHHPELLELVRRLTERGQLEVMSGAYYEPIISVIPEADRRGQIEKLSRRVESLFAYRPKGMWLAERVWEPTLPSTLHDAGMRYTVIDDTHFKYAGLNDSDLDGYFVSEDLGKKVFLFPINKQLRYTIPFQDVQATLDVLKAFASEDGEKMVVFADDGEKFGVWPGTHHHVYNEGWLETFFTTLEENLDWIEMVHFSEALEQVKPKEMVYLPTASYAEMMEWSLFTPAYKAFETFEHVMQEKQLDEEYGRFVRGGFWRNFMVKYPEINVMHKKMLRISNRLWNLPKTKRAQLQQTFDHLWAAQCNCPYWHGVFGGLYLSHLRHAIFNNLLDAEKQMDALQPARFPLLEVSDFDVDGFDEVLVETPVHDAYFRPRQGAALFEYDFKPVSKNLSDTMSRREEGYHSKLKDAAVPGQEPSGAEDGTASIHDLVLAKEDGLADYLNYDWYERKSFIDHFLGADTTPESFEKAAYKEDGDFVNQPYELVKKRRTRQEVTLWFERQGHVWHEGMFEPLTIRKTLHIDNDSADIRADYELINTSGKSLTLQFAIEFNYGLQAGHAEDRYYYLHGGKPDDPYLDSRGIIPAASEIGLKDEYMKIDIHLQTDQTAHIWRVPVETISLSEAGFERVYQSSSVLLKWNIKLDETWSVRVQQNVSTF